jgi:putative FmdB family regulatory protein
MPIYEYRCAACGHQDEHLQKVSDAPLTKCPSCGKPRYQKQLSAAGFQLKGTGWYATDFKGSAKKAADKKTETKTESKPDSKPDSKPEKKPESKAAA